MELTTALIILIGVLTTCQCHIVNQHVCNVTSHAQGLQCLLTEEGVYQPDRRLAGVKSIHFQANVSAVTIELRDDTPDLETVLVDNHLIPCDNVSVKPWIQVYINGQLCSETRSFGTTPETTTTSAKTTFGTDGEDKRATSSARKYHDGDGNGGEHDRLIVIIIILAAFLGTTILIITCLKVRKCLGRKGGVKRLDLDEEVVQFELPAFKCD